MTTTLAADVPPASAADHAPLLERAFFGFEPREASYAVTDVEGEVPPWLRGTYYLNGPGRSQRGELRYRHWLDGDGMVSALRFEAGGAHFTHRFVTSTKLTEEDAAGRGLYRTFATSFDGDKLVRDIALASPVNVSVYPFAGRLLAFGEQGLPWELDPLTLETRGEHTFGRRLNGVSPFAAHPHVDLRTGEMWNFGTSFSARRPLLHLYRFTAAGELADRFRIDLDAPRSVHDFALSPSYAVFYLSPYVLDMEALSGGATLLEALVWEPGRGSRLLVVSRASGEPVADVAIGSGYCLHLVGCFERGGLLSVDVLELDRPVYDQYMVPELFPDARGARPARYLVDVAAGEVAATAELDYRSMCDFPGIDPRRQLRDYGDFWMLGIAGSDRPGRKFFDQLVHCDWHRGQTVAIWRAPERCYLGGEPVFLPEPGNARGGAVICQRFDAEACESAFLLFDAFDVGRGPSAVLRLREPVRLGFHATFDPAGAATGRAATGAPAS